MNSDSVSSVTLTGTAAATSAPTGVGTLTGAITASGASGTGLSNYLISYVAGNASIIQAALTVTANAQSRTYGATNPALTYTTTGLVNNDTLTGSLTTTATTASSVGNYAITQGSLAASSNYAVTYNGANLTITQAALTVTANAQSRVYGAANPALTYTQTGLVNGDTLSGILTTTATPSSSVGSYAITQGTLTASSNYAVTYNSANLTVTAAPLTITADAQSRAYGAANPALTYTQTGLVAGDSLTGSLTTSATTESSTGTYPIMIGSLNNPNYTITYNGADLAITAAPQTVAASAAMAAAVATVVTVSTNVAVSRYAVTQGDQLGSSSYSSGIVNTALTIQPVGQITLINNGINIPGDLTPSASVGTINTQIKKSLATTNDSASITAGTQ